MKFLHPQQPGPIDDQLAEADIQDRLQLANTLRQRSMEGASLDNVGGHLIGSPWARALSSAAQGIQGAGERKRAYTMAGDLATSKRERLTQALGGAGQEPTPEARLKRGMELMGHPDPQAQAVGRYMAESAQKEIDQRQKALDAQRGETNKDLRHMQDLYQRDQAARAQAAATAAAAKERNDTTLEAARIRAAGHGGANGGGADPYSTIINSAKYGQLPFNTRTQEVTLPGIGPIQLKDLPQIEKDHPELEKFLVKPADDPATQRDVAAGRAEGREGGLAEARLADYEAALPHLEKVVTDLSALGKKATYTLVGQGRDVIKRQLGMKVGEGATARVEYMKKVDNEVLPLLRQTFGAQFTLQEGRDLRTTLGDPDLSPEEKDAALIAFIDAQRAKIETAKRRVATPAAAPPPGEDDDALIGKYLNGQP